jgi:glutathione S-transferase
LWPPAPGINPWRTADKNADKNERDAMKLYADPISTTCRPILLFAAETGINLQIEFIDLFKGANQSPDYAKINPNCQVPCLDDGGFCLTESSAILKYLAEKTNSPLYPQDLKRRARVNQMMDWFNTGFYHAFGYDFVYPQILDHLKFKEPVAQGALLNFGREQAKKCLAVLNDHWLGHGNEYLCGNEITIADHFGACLITAGEVAHVDLAAWPNVTRWLRNVKALPSWGKVNEPFYQRFVGAFKDAPMEKF